MKSTGVVRNLDQLGRIVLPIELRRNFELKEGDSLEIYTEGETIILKKYEPACVFCGEASGVVNFKGKNVCKECLREIKGGR
ncbi:AbrB/MazE/SpoVT family DNA-binding domain-containing protein [Clostridium sp. HBUAS56017]|uniref:AbrB/MazE/SpoVT family DNA-binding domain-containing protein n=1 Tax=Clostridium sp. HBUAS56017 TaxID=2571128 RepID=UPI00117820E8|nr:AbrB/MazE/SpoVT family DNA-binding domain-containing protein [Clostridium sp. HBUAS56017]